MKDATETTNNIHGGGVMDLIPAQGGPIDVSASLEKLVEAFLVSQDVSKVTRDTYRRSLRSFTRWLISTGRAAHMNTLTGVDILAYKDSLSNLSPYTQGLYLTAVRRLFGWMEQNRGYPDITRGIKGPRKPRGFRKDTLTRDQLRDAMESIDRSTVKGKRDYAVFNLMARTGLRGIEVSRAKVGDLRQTSGQAVLYVHGKGRSEADEFVILVPETLNPIREYLSFRGEPQLDAPLFASTSRRNRGQAMTTASVRKIIKGILRDIDIDDPRLTTHSLRHSCISMAVEGGASIQEASAMARHASIQTTMIYYHAKDRITNGAEYRVQI